MAPPLLLTGAGFTCNFGGFLADGMFAMIQTYVRGHRVLLDRLKQSRDYEYVYGGVVFGGLGGKDERELLLAAMKDAYSRLDAVVRYASHNRQVGVDYTALRQFIARFSGTRGSRERGYFFTLNQDLFVERHLGIAAGDTPLHLHGQLPPPLLHQQPERELTPTDCVVLSSDSDHYRRADEQSSTSFHYVKLHGSFNWQTSDGALMVVGQAKEELIAKVPILQYNLETFERELYKPRRRLCVIGYGFRDRHINARIARALEHHDLQLFVISPQSIEDLRQSFYGPKGSHQGHFIWPRLIHWPVSLSQLFPVSSPGTRNEWAKVIDAAVFGGDA